MQTRQPLLYGGVPNDQTDDLMAHHGACEAEVIFVGWQDVSDDR